MLNSYEIPAADTDDLLKLISRTVTGRALLEDFLPLLAKGKISIRDYPSPMREKLRKFIPPGHAIGACLIEGQILVDFEAPRGVVAAFLVHEIASLVILKQRSTLCREELEAASIKKQLQFTTELRDRDPDYERFLRANTAKASHLNGLLEFELEDAA